MTKTPETKQQVRFEESGISSFEDVDSVCLWVRAFLHNRVARKQLFRIELVMREALTNALLHGHRMDPDKCASLRVWFENDELYIAVQDEGAGFCRTGIKNNNGRGLAEYGRGFEIFRQNTKDYSFNETGNEIVLRMKKENG